MGTLLDVIRSFAQDMCRTPLYDCGYADPWSMVARCDANDIPRQLAYVHGFADACRLATDYMSPAWQTAQLVGIAAGMFATLWDENDETGRTVKDPAKIAASYRAELAALAEERRNEVRSEAVVETCKLCGQRGVGFCGCGARTVGAP